jgi:hypothetical protein
MPRYSTPAELMNAMGPVSDYGLGKVGDSFFEGLAFGQKMKANRGISGSPAVPDEIITQKPFMAGARGYQTFTPGQSTDNANINLVTGHGSTVYYRPGKEATLGRLPDNEFSLRQQMLPYIKYDPDDPTGSDNNIKQFLSEPDRGKALKYIQFVPKNNKAPVVVDEAKLALMQGTPLGDKIELGMKFSADEWSTMEKLAKYNFQNDREDRLKKTVGLDTQLKATSLAIRKAKLDKVKSDADTDRMMADLMQGFGVDKKEATEDGMIEDLTNKSAISTKKKKAAAAFLEANKQPVTDANIKAVIDRGLVK